jgi:hypothetical protein
MFIDKINKILIGAIMNHVNLVNPVYLFCFALWVVFVLLDTGFHPRAQVPKGTSTQGHKYPRAQAPA